MQKYPSDVSVSENCIDANLEMVERRGRDNFPHCQPQEWCAWTIHEIVLNSGDFCRLLIAFTNSLDPDQNRQNSVPDLDPNLLTP